MKTKRCILWLKKASRGFRAPIALQAAMGVGRVCASLWFIFLSKRLVDLATSATPQPLLPAMSCMLCCMALQLALDAAHTRLAASSAAKLTNVLRQRLFMRTMQAVWTGKERHHTGDVLNRLEEDVRTVVDTLCSVIPNTCTTLLQLTAAFGFLWVLEARLAWILLFIMPLALCMSKVYFKKMRALTRAIRTTDSRVQAHLQEHLQHRNLLRTLQQADRSANTLSVLQQTWMSQVMQRTDFSLFSRTAVQVGFAAGYATTFLWGIFGLQSGAVTFGMMTAFLQLVMQVQRPVVDLSRQIPGFVHTLTSVERLAELDDLPQEEGGEAVALQPSIGIRIEKLSFCYPDSTDDVLQEFSHHFAPGSLTAIVGETGVGKSTLIRLMLALLQPRRGAMTLYNKVEQVAVSPRTRCNFSYVPQGNTLMSGTIRENLLLGNPHATDDALKKALHTAAADFVFELPEGWNTLCGEGGMGLSEGQAQRIAIARGLLRPGGILLLDEPTSALDSNTQQALMQRLKAACKDKTILLITHNKEMVQGVDDTIQLMKMN